MARILYSIAMPKIFSAYRFLTSIFCAGICLLSFELYAQGELVTEAPSKKSDEFRFEPAVGFGSSSLQFSLKNNGSSKNEGEGEDISYKTTNDSFYFVSMAYRGVSLSAKMPIADSEEVRNEQGNTKGYDYQLGFGLFKNWHAEFYRQKYQGYYVETPDQSIIVLPDMKMENTGAQLIYVFKPEYAYAVLRDANSKQLQSGGSWTLGLGFNRFLLQGDLSTETIDPEIQGSFEGATADSISIRPGYGYNWIWKNWHAGIFGGLGFNYNQIRYAYVDEVGHTVTTANTVHGGMASGYTWGQNRFGFFSRVYNSGLGFSDKKVTTRTLLAGFFISRVF